MGFNSTRKGGWGVNLNSLRIQLFLLAPRCWGCSARKKSVSEQQKFHTDDINQGLHNKSGSHGVSNVI